MSKNLLYCIAIILLWLLVIKPLNTTTNIFDNAVNGAGTNISGGSSEKDIIDKTNGNKDTTSVA